MINKQQNQHLLIRQKKQNNTNFIMKQNKLFENVLQSTKTINNYNPPFNKLFEAVMQNIENENDVLSNWAEYFSQIIENSDNENGDDSKLTVYSSLMDKPLTNIFDSILSMPANENQLDYSTISIRKKSVPFKPLQYL